MADKPNIPIESRGQDTPNNRAYERRRDDDVFTTPKITIYDIDYAIIWWLQNKIKPTLEIDGNVVEVPVTYSNGEKWAQIQANGFLRDDSGLIKVPLITLMRTSLGPSDLWSDFDTENSPTAMNLRLLPPRDSNSKYDFFNRTSNAKQPEEYYLTAIPKFITCAYDLIVWTDHIEQMNHIVQDIWTTSGFAWGDTWRFQTDVGDFSFETAVSDSDERVVRATSTLTVQGFLLDDFQLKVSNAQKAYSLKRVKFSNEKSSFDVRFGEPDGGYPTEASTSESKRAFLKFLQNSGFEI